MIDYFLIFIYFWSNKARSINDQSLPVSNIKAANSGQYSLKAALLSVRRIENAVEGRFEKTL